MKRWIKKLIYAKPIAKVLLNLALKLHSKTYAIASRLSIIVDNGVHPKHRIMRYKEWFLDNIQKDWIVLDVGCNTGMMPETMSEKAKFVYGIEIDCAHVATAKEQRQKDNVEFICADATTYDYSKCYAIDCITLSNVLEHIENRVEFLKKLASNIKWNHKKRFLIRVPMIDREWIVLYKQELGLDYRLDPTHFTEYTFYQFKHELDAADITIESYEIRFGEIYAVCSKNG